MSQYFFISCYQYAFSWINPSSFKLKQFSFSRYESIIATLCESLDTLDEPEAKVLNRMWIFCHSFWMFSLRHNHFELQYLICLSLQASMIWIIGEYAERIDNADELLESFLETFPEEPPQVQLQLLTATVKLFLKKPTEGPQQMIQVCIIDPLYFMHTSNSSYNYWLIHQVSDNLGPMSPFEHTHW